MAVANEKLRAAREAMPSRAIPGAPMSRSELAEQVNAYLWEASQRKTRTVLDGHTIGRYERGDVRWPGAAHRAGLRAVLNVATDAELGFWPTRRGRASSLVELSGRSVLRAGVAAGVSLSGDADEKSLVDFPGQGRRSLLVADVAFADLTTVNRDFGTERIRARDGELLLRLAEQTAFGPAALSKDSGSGRSGRLVTENDAAAIETATAMFRAWDNAQGGGLRRKAVIGQLVDTMALLDGPFENEQAARRCYSAVADLAQLAGWMTWDLQFHATAQNYYLLGLALARDAGDRSQVARMMYCLSRQMIDLGRPVDALDLAAAGSYAIRHQTPPKATALLLVAQARAHACLGAEQECRASLGAAQDSFTGDAPDREWCSFFDGAEFAGLTGVTLRDLALAAPHSAPRIAAEARGWTEKAANERSAAFLRSKILDTDGIAVTSLLAGEPDRAALATADALALTSRLRSPRTIRRVTDTIAMGAHAFPRAAPWDDLADRVQALPGSAPVA